MNVRQSALPITTAALLCLTLCCLVWASTASAAEAGFMLTEQSLDNLRQEGLPNEILIQLKAIQDQKFDTENELLEAVKSEIGSDRTNRYKEQILKYTADEIGVEIDRILEALKAQKRTIDALLAQNRALEERLAELETAREERTQKQAEEDSSKQKELEQRVKELEATETARDDATRSIIRDALSTVGSKINESVALGGSLQVVAGAAEKFQGGQSENVLEISNADLDFEIQLNDWSLASVIFQYNATRDLAELDRAFLTIGDTQRFPPFLTAGRIVVPFGTSTGNPVADFLTIVDPLTIELFEQRENALLFGFGFPTPPIKPPTPPVTPPRVRPLVINPLFGSITKALGLKSFSIPRPLPAITPTPAPPLFNGGIYFYNGNTKIGFSDTWRLAENYGATVGFRTQGHCGRPFDQLVGSAFCPWKIDIDIDYNSSVFDSLFFESEYVGFISQIKSVPGMAAHFKSTFGPFGLIGEWDGAVNSARFFDGRGNPVSITPSAWQVSLAYQFDWNPWIEVIGAQGNYFTVSYSGSRDLGGVTQLIGDVPTRVGFVPKRRLLIGAGEWFMDNLKFAIEYTYEKDYPRSEGGTGNSAHGFFTELTAVW